MLHPEHVVHEDCTEDVKANIGPADAEIAPALTVV